MKLESCFCSCLLLASGLLKGCANGLCKMAVSGAQKTCMACCNGGSAPGGTPLYSLRG